MGFQRRILCIFSLLILSLGTTNAFFFFNPFPNPTFLSGLNANFRQPGQVQIPKQGSVQAVSRGGKSGGELVVPESQWTGAWELFLKNSGVSAMHAVLLPKINKIQFYDATIWRISQIKLPPGVKCHFVKETGLTDCWAHSVLLDIKTGNLRALKLDTDTWCSSGGLMKNGTLVSTGGFQGGANTARYLRDCNECDWIEYPTALATARWYSTQVTLADGRFIVVGGRDAMNYEYIPQEGTRNTQLFELALLKQTKDQDENNLYPFVYLSTDGNLFIFANNRSILLNPKSNQVVHEFPVLRGGARNYPGSGSSALLPIHLHPVNGQVISADVLVCGGSPHNAFSLAGKNIFVPALSDCGRITITNRNARWKMEKMPSPRVLGDTIILPNGDVLIVNGAKKGSAGWNFAKDPNLTPVMYCPEQKLGLRFRQMTATNIPRMYHSSSVLLPDGKVLVAGSNTNNGYLYNNVEFPTELRVEKFSPPYLDPKLAHLRPTIVAGASTATTTNYGKKFNIQIKSREQSVLLKDIRVTMYAPAFTTHSISMNQRLIIVGLEQVAQSKIAGYYDISAVAPPSGNVAPPGYYLLYVVYKGVPSVGEWFQIL